MTQVATSTLQVTCAVLLAAHATMGAQSVPPPNPSPSDRLALASELRDSMEAVLGAAVRDSAFPGAFAIVGDSRGTLAQVGVGHLDWRPSPRPTVHTLWDLASLTKVIGTTTALAQLIERRAIDLNAPVQRYVPDWVGPGKDVVTVRQLLTHTSGLPSFRPYDTLTHNPDSLAALLFNTELVRVPGDSMVYSDIGAFMMGRIVERVSGQRLDRYLAQHVFAPLRMRETMFNPPHELWANVAPTEYDSLRGGLVHGKVHDERAYYLGGVAAHAGLFSSAFDLSRFATMMLRGGMLDSTRILRWTTLAEFTAYTDTNFSNRALGWQKPELPTMRFRSPSSSWAGRFMSREAFGHTGFTGTSIAVDPELDLYVILLSNRVNPTRNNPRITDVRSHLADAIVTTVRRRRGQTISAEVPGK